MSINTTCSQCGCDKPKIFVHGHYQCADCKCVTDPCCDGEQSSTSKCNWCGEIVAPDESWATLQSRPGKDEASLVCDVCGKDVS